MGVVGILISLGLLMWLAYRGITVLVLAPLLALLAVLFDGDVRLLGIYTQVFMTALGGFLVKFFPVFLLGAIFGRLMADSGAAETIARAIVSKLGSSRAMLAVVLACGVLTYGGVSLRGAGRRYRSGHPDAVGRPALVELPAAQGRRNRRRLWRARQRER
jgi:H+/gluconate symporter-like permease